jgi:hypothetical protein
MFLPRRSSIRLPCRNEVSRYVKIFHADPNPKDLQELPKMTSHPLIQIIQFIQ